MITAIFILSLLVFIQSALLNVDLILLIIIVKSFIEDDRLNYWMALFLGMFVSLLSNSPLGVLSMFYLVMVKVVYLVKTIPFSSSWLMIIPLAALCSALEQLFKMVLYQTSFELTQLIWQVILVIPLYFAMRLWQERIGVRMQFKVRSR